MAHEKCEVSSGTQLRFVIHDSVTEADNLRPESEVREYLSPSKVIALNLDRLRGFMERRKSYTSSIVELLRPTVTPK